MLLLAYQNCANKVEFKRNLASLESSEPHIEEPIDTPQIPEPIEAPPQQEDKIICDPFHGELSACDRGFYGSLYTLEPEIAMLPENRHVNSYFDLGTKVNEDGSFIVFPQLMYPTQNYTQGFRFEDDYLRDNEGNKLFEYFALDLKALLYLNEMEPGWYQFALVSDDGSTLETFDPLNNQSQMLIDNDGYHSTKKKCSNATIYIGPNDVLPLRLKYFQGPRTAIALSLIWRKAESQFLNTDNDLKAQETCEVVDADFFGPRDTNPLERIEPQEGTHWHTAHENGWMVLRSENLVRFSQW
jgi:hypothetical protein